MSSPFSEAQSTGNLLLPSRSNGTGSHPSISEEQGNEGEQSLKERERSTDKSSIDFTKCSSQKCPIQVSVPLLKKKLRTRWSLFLMPLYPFLLLFPHLFIPSQTSSEVQACRLLNFAKAAHPDFEFTSRQVHHSLFAVQKPSYKCKGVLTVLLSSTPEGYRSNLNFSPLQIIARSTNDRER